ncbi:MAG: sensor histidine kinase [Ferruginibacter sp.]
MSYIKGKCRLSFFIFLYFLLATSSIPAQSKWEQLEPAFADSTETARLGFYISAAKDLFFANRKLSETYAHKAFFIADAGNNHLYEKGDLHNFLGIIAIYNAGYDEADMNLQKALAIAKQLGNEALELKARTNIALNSSKRGDYQKAVAQNFDLLRLVEKKGSEPPVLANIYANLSNAYYYLSQLKEAEKYQLKALQLFESSNNKKGMANAWNTLGTISTDLKQYERAAVYLNKSLALKKELGDSLGMANAYNNLVNLNDKLDRKPEHLRALQNSERLYKALKDDEGLANNYLNYGSYYYKQKDWLRAVEFENRAIKLAGQTKNNYVLSAAYENLSKSYAKLNHPDSALTFSNKALVAKDSLYESGLQNQIADVQVRYETEKKEKQIKEQQLELQQKQYSLLQRNYIIAAVVSLLLLTFVFAHLFYKRNKLKQAIHLQLEIIRQQDLSTKAVLTAEENERVRIAKDLHDGIGQMMSVAKMNLSAMEDELLMDAGKKLKFDKVIQLVDESCKEVRMVSHNMMPNALLKAGLAAAIAHFIDKIDNRILKINFYSEGLNERLESSTETILYRVIQECVNNVIKHAAANQLDISLIKDSEGISATIEDNGKGFDKKQVLKSEGIGLKNIRTRMEYLKGTVEWNTADGKGTLVALHVPNNIIQLL